MHLFNSFQIVAAFVAWPFGISYLFSLPPFPGQTAAIVAACGLYVIAFGAMVAAVYDSTSRNHW